MKKRLLGLPAALIALSLIGGSGAVASTPAETGSGNPVCDGIKIDGVDGDVESGTYVTGGGTFIINKYMTSLGWVFDWASPDTVVSAVTVKGGTMYNLYLYNPAVQFDNTGLHAPVNPNNKNGYYYGLSHICFEGEKK